MRRSERSSMNGYFHSSVIHEDHMTSLWYASSRYTIHKDRILSLWGEG